MFKSQGVEEPSCVVKRTIHLPRDQPGDIAELLTRLQRFKIDDEAYMAIYFQILAKDPKCRHMLQPPTAYVPVISAKQLVLHPHPGPPLSITLLVSFVMLLTAQGILLGTALLVKSILG